MSRMSLVSWIFPVITSSLGTKPLKDWGRWSVSLPSFQPRFFYHLFLQCYLFSFFWMCGVRRFFSFSEEVVGSEPSLLNTEGGLRLPFLDLPSWDFYDVLASFDGLLSFCPSLSKTDMSSWLAPEEVASFFLSALSLFPLELVFWVSGTIDSLELLEVLPELLLGVLVGSFFFQTWEVAAAIFFPFLSSFLRCSLLLEGLSTGTSWDFNDLAAVVVLLELEPCIISFRIPELDFKASIPRDALFIEGIGSEGCSRHLSWSCVSFLQVKQIFRSFSYSSSVGTTSPDLNLAILLNWRGPLASIQTRTRTYSTKVECLAWSSTFSFFPGVQLGFLPSVSSEGVLGFLWFWSRREFCTENQVLDWESTGPLRRSSHSQTKGLELGSGGDLCLIGRWTGPCLH